MKMEESVPNTTPRIIANEKLRMLSPPRKKIHSNTSNVENEVLRVRAKVSLSDLLNIVCKSALRYNPRFSRIRSNTTTLSLME